MLKLRVRNGGKSKTNRHGTHFTTVRGWKVTVVDLIQGMNQKTRAKWYKRFILYAPSGAWWHVDVCLAKDWRKP